MGSILTDAEEIIHGARRADYGTPLDNHSRTAEFWTTFLSRKAPGLVITAEDVCQMNILQKISRMATTGKVTRDGIQDIAGYAGNIELVQSEREARKHGGSH